MTDFQIILIVLGIVIIIGVIVYNKWQEHKASKKVQRAFADAPEDVLMQSRIDESVARKEPEYLSNIKESVKDDNPAKDASVQVASLDSTLDNANAHSLGETENVGVEESSKMEPVFSDEIPQSEKTYQEPYIDLSETEEKTFVQPESKLDEVDFVATQSIAQPLIPSPSVDDLIDYPIALSLEEPIRGEKLLPLMQSLRYTRNNKPIHFVGLARDVQTGKESWQSIVHGGIYHQLKIGVQLANRTGYLNEIEYSELITRLRQVSDSIGAEPEIPNMTDVIHIARSLYQFVVEHDARLGINIRTGGAPWAVKTLVAVLERQNFDLRPDGLFVMHDDDGSVLFTLSINALPAADTAGRLTLLLDVPCVAHEKNGFVAMVQCAKSLCQRLNGVLVDDDDNMLSDAMLEDIANQVNVFYEEMSMASIPAGSVRAMRLFN